MFRATVIARISITVRSEEHTSELQSQSNLVCRLLLEKNNIEPAVTVGTSKRRIIVRHILPNVIAPYLVLLTAFHAQPILLEASLSFLRLRASDPRPAS